MAAGDILVLGVGNVLMSDDGFGPAIIDALRERFEFPPEVELLDAGTPGLNLAAVMMDRQAMIVIDAITAAGQPGELRFHRKCDLIRREARPRLNPHEPALIDLLAFLDLAGRGAADVFVVGAIPESIRRGTELSAPVRAAKDPAIAAVLDELRRLGVEARHTAPAIVNLSHQIFRLDTVPGRK
jgi:hydrogenase maturation protease